MKTSLAGAAVVALVLTGCSVKKAEPGAAAAPKAYVVGMGEIMGQNQMRHAKLWFAGTAQNWPLAQYEVDELNEGFRDVKSFHPTFKKRPTAPLVDEFVTQPLGELDKAVKDKNAGEFTAAFDDLTNGCDGCHKELGFGFNVIQRPTSPEYTNQQFAPVKPG